MTSSGAGIQGFCRYTAHSASDKCATPSILLPRKHISSHICTTTHCCELLIKFTYPQEEMPTSTILAHSRPATLPACHTPGLPSTNTTIGAWKNGRKGTRTCTCYFACTESPNIITIVTWFMWAAEFSKLYSCSLMSYSPTNTLIAYTISISVEGCSIPWICHHLF